MRLLKLSLILIVAFALQGFKIDPLQQPTDKSGIIQAFDLEDRNMTINNVVYRLDDHMYVVNNNNIARGDGVLETGQKIEFWVAYDPNSGLALIKKIRVLTDIKMAS